MITDIRLQHFRSYKDESFELSPGVNIIIGPNASGKTNLLEALLVSARGGSYRAKDTELINLDSNWARIETNTNNFNRIIRMEKTNFDKIDKTFETNTKRTNRLSLSQSIPIVLFEPNHLLLLSGSPELRRNYIDDILEQTTLGYKTLKGQYKRALTQRNTLLKSTKPKNPELFVWNVRLSELGGKLFRKRLNLVEKLKKDTSKLYNSLSGGKEQLEFIYKTNINIDNYESDLLKNLENNIDKDTLRGFTSYGPHRDDLQILIDNKLASEVASRGETRTIILVLKMIETQMIENTRQQKPILLFDDVFSELDGARRLALTSILSDHQSIITTTDADIVIQHFTQITNIIPIVKNKKT